MLKFSYNLVVVKAIRSLFIVPVAILVALTFVILAPLPAKLVTLIAVGNLALSTVPVGILVALTFVILAPLPAKLVTLRAVGNLVLSIVPVNLVAERLDIPVPTLIVVRTSSIELITVPKFAFLIVVIRVSVLLLILLMMHQNH